LGWTMLHPLLSMVVLTLVFSSIFRFSVEHYAVYILSGLLLWTFLATGTTHAMTQLAWGGGLLNRIYLPKAAFAVSAIGTGLVNLGLALVPLLVIAVVSGLPLTWSLLTIPGAVLLTAMFALGVALLLSALAVYYVDVVNMYEIVLTLWMYLTPIIYPIDILPEGVRAVVELNPMYYLVELFRAPIYAGVVPGLDVWLKGLGVAAGMLLVGWWYFTRQADEIAYRV
jgi:ABC-type polysaccharide/polyol phosphate export permease